MISLVPFKFDDDDLLHQIRVKLSQIFKHQIRIYKEEIDYAISFDETRLQYNSTKILEYLISTNNDPDDRLLGITSIDLFIPILTFVFGEAQLNGKTAVVSSKRLDPAYYGLAPDKNLQNERLIKEIVHELGHVMGLLHCKNIDCVMRSSTYVEEIDVKKTDFCTECRKLIRNDVV